MRLLLHFITAVMLVLLSTGFDSIFAQSTSCPVPAHQGNWSLRQPLPIMSSEFGAASLNGLIFAAGGYNPENHAAFLIYDSKKNTWTEGPDLAKGLTPATAYTFRITARNGCGDSTPSVTATATTRP